jgi:N6-adenosine-specific RNA methylase IME4
MKSDAELRRDLRQFRARRLEAQRLRRAERERALGAWISSAPSLFVGEVYGLIYADPPWHFINYSDAGMGKSAANHYPTMTLEAIKALEIPAAADSVLFLWSTTPMLGHAFEVLEAWRFAYVSAITWDKVHPGHGYWTRDRSELLLIATRGEIPAPAPGLQPESLFSEPRGEHSVKPARVYAMLEAMFPTLPKLEVFARQGAAVRPGWNVWGFEASPVN